MWLDFLNNEYHPFKAAPLWASQPQVETIHFTFKFQRDNFLYFRNRSIRFLHYHCPRIVHNSKLSKIPAHSRSSNCKHRGDAQSLSARILDFIFPTCITFLETGIWLGKRYLHHDRFFSYCRIFLFINKIK